ncbi:putative ribonuclease H-like domain-containing protein, partial [Tanacetum coccineum]
KPTEVDENEASDKSGKHNQEARIHLLVLLDHHLIPVNTAGPSVSTANESKEQLFERFSPFKNAFTLPPVLNISSMDNTGIFRNAYDDEDVEEEVDMNNAIGTKWVFRNKKDERGIVVKNKARLVAQGHTQEEGIDYDEVFTPVVRIEAIRLFLAYASFKDFVVYQMNVKSAFQYGKIEEEVYVCQPPGFEDPYFPDKVYKVEKALYGLYQAPRAWYETLTTYLLENGFHMGEIDITLFTKRQKYDILLVQVYVDDIIFGSTKKHMSNEFETLMHDKFQIGSIGELSFFLGLQVKQKSDGIFISRDKYVAKILKKFYFASVKIASTPMETNKALIKDEEAEDVDVHLYRSMIGSLMYLTASRPDIMFAVCACARFQVTPKIGMHVLFLCCDEAVHKSWVTEWKRAFATTTSSLEAEQDSVTLKLRPILAQTLSGTRCQDTILGDVDAQTRLETTSKQFNNSPLSKVNTFGSRKDSSYPYNTYHELRELMTTLYKTVLELIWATTKVKTVNDVRHIQALIDKKKLIITETSIRSDLHSEECRKVFINQQLRDMSHHKKIFVNPSQTKKFFANMKREGKDFSRRITPLFDTMMVQASKEVGEDFDHLTDSNQIPIVLDLEKAKSDQAIEIASLKKRVYKLEKGRMFRTTGLKRLKKAGATRRIESSNDSLGAQEDASKQGRRIKDIDADAEVTLVNETQERQDEDLMFDTGVLDGDEMFVDATIGKKDEPKAREVVVQEPSEFRTSPKAQPSKSKDKGKAIMIEPKVPLKRKDQVALDEDLARNIQAQLDAEIIEEERLERQN